MATSTKEALGAALKQMMAIKPINKITVKDLVTICNVNRQTFYYHFDDVYDLLEWVFEEDANRILPRVVKYETWQDDVMVFFNYLYENRTFALNVYNSNSRIGMLKYLTDRVQACINSFCIIISEGRNIDRQDFEFVVELFANSVVGLLSRWLDYGMEPPTESNKQRFLCMLENSMENLLDRFKLNK